MIKLKETDTSFVHDLQLSGENLDFALFTYFTPSGQKGAKFLSSKDLNSGADPNSYFADGINIETGGSATISFFAKYKKSTVSKSFYEYFIEEAFAQSSDGTVNSQGVQSFVFELPTELFDFNQKQIDPFDPLYAISLDNYPSESYFLRHYVGHSSDFEVVNKVFTDISSEKFISNPDQYKKLVLIIEPLIDDSFINDPAKRSYFFELDINHVGSFSSFNSRAYFKVASNNISTGKGFVRLSVGLKAVDGKYIKIKQFTNSRPISSGEKDYFRILKRISPKRYGKRDFEEGGDDWVWDPVSYIINGGYINDISNLNGGGFFQHKAHKYGLNIDMKLFENPNLSESEARSIKFNFNDVDSIENPKYLNLLKYIATSSIPYVDQSSFEISKILAGLNGNSFSFFRKQCIRNRFLTNPGLSSFVLNSPKIDDSDGWVIHDHNHYDHIHVEYKASAETSEFKEHQKPALISPETGKIISCDPACPSEITDKENTIISSIRIEVNPNYIVDRSTGNRKASEFLVDKNDLVYAKDTVLTTGPYFDFDEDTSSFKLVGSGDYSYQLFSGNPNGDDFADFLHFMDLDPVLFNKNKGLISLPATFSANEARDSYYMPVHVRSFDPNSSTCQDINKLATRCGVEPASISQNNMKGFDSCTFRKKYIGIIAGIYRARIINHPSDSLAYSHFHELEISDSMEGELRLIRVRNFDETEEVVSATSIIEAVRFDNNLKFFALFDTITDWYCGFSPCRRANFLEGTIFDDKITIRGWNTTNPDSVTGTSAILDFHKQQ